jgi:hypothetical protein
VPRTIRILVAVGIVVALCSGDVAAGAESDRRVLVASPGQTDDSVGDTVQPLKNSRYRVSVPSSFVRGARVFRVAQVSTDDQADEAADAIKLDEVPKRGTYGPFIRLPGHSRDRGDADADGWNAA